MGILSIFRRVNRKAFFLCYECMTHMSLESEPEAAKAIFFDNGEPEMIDGRSHYRCPRCQAINTVSFQYLKETQQSSQLFGLEQIVKNNPQSFFEVKPSA